MGVFLNKAVIGNTLDSAPYFGMSLHIGMIPAVRLGVSD